MVQAGQVVFPAGPPGPGAPPEEQAGGARRATIIAALIGAVGACAAALVGGILTLAKDDGQRPEFRVSGECLRHGQVLTGVSRGLTPGGDYKADVRDPDGGEYRGGNVTLSGTVAPNGSVAWYWHCVAGTKPGVYRIRLEDTSSGGRTRWTAFRVATPP